MDSAHGRQRDDQMQRDAGDVVLLLSAQSVDRRRRQLLAELVAVDILTLTTTTTTKLTPEGIFTRFSSVFVRALTARSSFFSERVTDIWNSLPSNAVDLTSVTRFKRSISLIDFL